MCNVFDQVSYIYSCLLECDVNKLRIYLTMVILNISIEDLNI